MSLLSAPSFMHRHVRGAVPCIFMHSHLWRNTLLHERSGWCRPSPPKLGGMRVYGSVWGLLSCNLSVNKVGNLFETHRSTIITVYNGAYDSSAFVFLIIKVMCLLYILRSPLLSVCYKKETWHFSFCQQLLYERGVSLQSSFLFLSLCGVLHLLRTLFLMPTGHIPYLLPENYTYGSEQTWLSGEISAHGCWRVVTHHLCSDRLGCPGQRTCKRKEEDGKQEAAASEPQAEVRMNLSSSKAEAKTSALDATIEPVPEKIQEEGNLTSALDVKFKVYFWSITQILVFRMADAFLHSLSDTVGYIHSTSTQQRSSQDLSVIVLRRQSQCFLQKVDFLLFQLWVSRAAWSLGYSSGICCGWPSSAPVTSSS